MDDWLEKRRIGDDRHFGSKPETRNGKKLYPAQVECTGKVLRTTTKITQVPAKRTVTFVAPRPTRTVTSTTTLVSTSTAIPPVVTSIVTESTTTAISSTSTSFVTATSTFTPPVVTQQAIATYYAACGPNNMLPFDGWNFKPGFTRRTVYGPGSAYGASRQPASLGKADHTCRLLR